MHSGNTDDKIKIFTESGRKQNLEKPGLYYVRDKHQSGCAGKEALYGEQEADCNHWQTVWKRRQ